MGAERFIIIFIPFSNNTFFITSYFIFKTSLLLALLEELNVQPSTDLQVKGSLFYVPQEPWIFTASIRQNILFGKPYEEEKFKRIIHTCCLEADLELFPDGEHTIVGEKGINLSGGQRARINLARALYSDAQIYLFDDPLSAVDASVARNIYDNCINGHLADKIRILVTHQVHFLSNANQIIYLSGGQMKFKGPYADLLKLDDSHIASDLENKSSIQKKGDQALEFDRQTSVTKSIQSYKSLSTQASVSEAESVRDDSNKTKND